MLKSIDSTVKKETLYIAITVVILSAVMQMVCVLASLWSLSFLLGNILGATASVLNFFLMGLTVQTALEKNEDKERKDLIKRSQALRMVMLLCVALVGCLVPCFHPVAVLIPFLFPRVAVTLRGLQLKK